MEMLDLLWDLELNQQSLEESIEERKKLDKDIYFKKLLENLEARKKLLDTYYEKEEVFKKSIRKKEMEFQAIKLKVEELEDSLYNDSSKDFKELEMINNEKNILEKSTNNLELELIEAMVELENIEDIIKKLDKECIETKTNILNKQKENQDEINSIEEKIISLNNYIDSKKDKIEEKILSKYYKIRKTKKKGIVLVKSNICSGCNLQISSIKEDLLEQNNQIVTCENCGRILYKEN